MNRKYKIKALHELAMQAAKQYSRAESALIEILQKIDAEKTFRDLGQPSLFAYAVNELKLSESTAYNFINVARKAMQVPALQQQISSGELSVCKARKIVPVLTLQNQEEWIEKDKILPSRKLEQEVARIAPRESQPERMHYVTDTRVSLSLHL